MVRICRPLALYSGSGPFTDELALLGEDLHRGGRCPDKYLSVQIGTVYAVISVWNSTTHTKMTVAEFYNSQIPVYSLDFVMTHYADLSAETFYVDCWVSTFEVSSTGWLYCTNTASDVHYPTEKEDDNGYEYDRVSHLQGPVARADYRYNKDGFTPLRAPALSRGDHIYLLCVRVQEPVYLDGEMIVAPKLIVSNIKKIN